MYEHVAVVGATGAVGSIVRQLLEERQFPFKTIKFLASARSAGTKLKFKGEEHTVEELRPHLAGFLKLHRTAAWDEMLQMPLIRSLCTEKRRERLVVIFRLKPDATWAELGFRVEELWARLQTAR